MHAENDCHYPAAVLGPSVNATLWISRSPLCLRCPRGFVVETSRRSGTTGISPAKLYLMGELGHYLAGSNYGSDTPED
ncbi:hypothetical protein BS412_00795 [Cronobacter turicensis]|nr:hypothetical protein [Cronobacter turicensis]PUX41691.1 hypothetical protein BS412_00795 [Cronobacter turicensis]